MRLSTTALPALTAIVLVALIIATALTTALSLGIISYAFSAFAIAMGAMTILFGLVIHRLRRADI